MGQSSALTQGGEEVEAVARRADIASVTQDSGEGPKTLIGSLSKIILFGFPQAAE